MPARSPRSDAAGARQAAARGDRFEARQTDWADATIPPIARLDLADDTVTAIVASAETQYNAPVIVPGRSHVVFFAASGPGRARATWCASRSRRPRPAVHCALGAMSWLKNIFGKKGPEPRTREPTSPAPQPDEPEIVRKMRAGAANGDVVAMRGLGGLYYQGKVVPKNLVESARWYDRAAASGDARAQFVLGSMYDRGEGVTKDPARAALWFERAARGGHADAQRHLARHLFDGDGVARDLVQAHAWTAVSLGTKPDDDTSRLQRKIGSRLSADDLVRAAEIAGRLAAECQG